MNFLEGIDVRHLLARELRGIVPTNIRGDYPGDEGIFEIFSVTEEDIEWATKEVSETMEGAYESLPLDIIGICATKFVRRACDALKRENAKSAASAKKPRH